MDILNDALISQPTAQKRLGISQMTLWRWRARPELGFPVPVKIGARSYFRASEISAWVASRQDGAAVVV